MQPQSHNGQTYLKKKAGYSRIDENKDYEINLNVILK